MAERIAEVGKNLAVYKVHVDELREQDVNARIQPPEMFERLTDTIRKEGRLEALPLVCNRGNFFEMISGHHRLRAARQAGLVEIFVLADERKLSRSQIVAKQLAHNSISGKDDHQTLKKLYDEIASVEDQLESFISPDDFNDVKQLEPAKATDIQIAFPYRQLTMVFMPDTMEAIDRLEAWAKKVPQHADCVGVVNHELFERFRKAVLDLGKVKDVRSMGVLMSLMVEIVEKHLEDAQDAAA